VNVGVAVAGGASRRMGRDKALLPWPGGDLLGHALRRLESVCDEVWISSGPDPRYVERGVRVVADAVRGAGALAGVHAGLRLLPASACGVFLGVDLPLVPQALLRRLLELAADCDAVVPVSPAGPEPLCAAYRDTCLAAVEARLAAGDAKMTAFWPDVRVRRLGPDELAEFGDPAALFLNVNSPDDYARALASTRSARAES
jgi:molybdopterin-guanine dinucleotide biosynthesis protein A